MILISDGIINLMTPVQDKVGHWISVTDELDVNCNFVEYAHGMNGCRSIETVTVTGCM